MRSTSVGTRPRSCLGLEEDDEEPPVVKFGAVAVGLEEDAVADEPVVADGLGGKGTAEDEVDEAAGVVVDGVDPGGAKHVGSPSGTRTASGSAAGSRCSLGGSSARAACFS